MCFSDQKSTSQNYSFNRVTCAHHKKFLILLNKLRLLWYIHELIMNICLWFPTLSVTIVMLLKMYYIVLCAIVLPLKTSSY